MLYKSLILLIGIVVLLVIIVAVLLWNNLHNQKMLYDKNELIMREMQENMQLREELFTMHNS